MKVRCAYTGCKNNIQQGDGYFCNQKTIHLMSIWKNNGYPSKMVCEQYDNKEGYALDDEQVV